MGISSSSPSWVHYLSYLNSFVFNGLQATTLISLKNLFIRMSSGVSPLVSIVVQLNDRHLSFAPPLVPLTSELSLEEIFQGWISLYLHRGELIDVLGDEQRRESFSAMISEDPLIGELTTKIEEILGETSRECLNLFEVFSQYSFLYQLPVNQSFQLFLAGEKRVKSSTPKNFLNEQDAGRRFVAFLSLSLFVHFPERERERKRERLTESLFFSFSMLFRFADLCFSTHLSPLPNTLLSSPLSLSLSLSLRLCLSSLVCLCWLIVLCLCVQGVFIPWVRFLRAN